MSFFLALALYCLLIIAASLLGGLIPMLIRMTHRRMQLALAAVAGFMLGIALLYLMPHAAHTLPISQVALWMLLGLLTMFFLERFLSFHHHTAPGDHGHPPVTADPQPETTCHHPGDPIDHTHGHSHAHLSPHRAKLSWLGAALGLTVHSLIDGASLAAAVSTDTGHGWLPGLAVFLVIVFHKPFDAMTLLTLISSNQWSRASRHLINAAFCLATPLGAILMLLGVNLAGGASEQLIASVLAFSAGVFLCIALTDLLPEVHFHTHDRLPLSGSLLLGLILASTLAIVEERYHDHGHDHTHHEHCDHDRGHGSTPRTDHPHDHSQGHHAH